MPAPAADIIVAATTPGALAAKHATRTVPIVMLGPGDPIGTGLVDSLARPGGNVTGQSSMAPGLSAKRLELLKELVPRITRVVVLANLADPVAPPQVQELEQAARALGVQLLIRDVRSPEDFPAAFSAAITEDAKGLLTTVETLFDPSGTHCGLRRAAPVACSVHRESIRRRWGAPVLWNQYRSSLL